MAKKKKTTTKAAAGSAKQQNSGLQDVEKQTAKTAHQQILVLQNLSQAAAAWLVGTDGRTLRDHAEIPRDEAGKYNAQDLLAWSASRLPAAELSEDEVERTLTAIDELTYGLEESAHEILERIDELVDRYGEAGMVAFARELVDAIRHIADMWPLTPAEHLTASQIRAEVEEETRRQIEQHGLDALDRATICDTCGRLRRGRRWAKTAPPSGFEVRKDTCPDCLQKLQAGIAASGRQNNQRAGKGAGCQPSFG